MHLAGYVDPEHHSAVLTDPTTFWQLYHAQGKAAGIPLEAAKGLADTGDWDAAIHDLEALIAGAKT